MSNAMLKGIRTYLLDRVKDEGVQLPHVFELKNSSVCPYYGGMIRLSPKARRDFEGKIMRYGHEYGLTLKSLGNGKAHYLIELREI